MLTLARRDSCLICRSLYIPGTAMSKAFFVLSRPPRANLAARGASGGGADGITQKNAC